MSNADLGFKTFLFSYEYAGREWSFEIVATDETDARRRVNRLHRARFDGELITRVEVPAGGVLRRVIEWWRKR